MSDLILVNANIITMEPSLPHARSVVISNGRITDLSTSNVPPCAKRVESKAEMIDCRGKTVAPGFIDPHFHLVSYADSFLILDFGPHHVSSITDMQNIVREAAQKLPPGAWIRGRGYNEFYLAEKRHPTRWDLDPVSPHHPVRITHRSGYGHLLNSLALELAGITGESGDPPGGLIDRDITTGEPTGLLYGMGKILARCFPATGENRTNEEISLAGQALTTLGITSVCDVSSRNNLSRMDLFRTWKEGGLIPQRVTMALGWEGFQKIQECGDPGFGADDQVRVEGVKIIIHEITGRLDPSQADLNEMVLQIHRSGYQAILHAIDEQPIAAACTAIEHALRTFPATGLKHRIEHCSVCPPALAKRIASTGIMVVTQPAFLYYNGECYLQTVPEDELGHLYPIATLMKHGIVVAGSSDSPVVEPNPLIGMYSAVSRKAKNGECLLPAERITPLQALSLFTRNAARATCTKNAVGSIRAGKLADLVMLRGDPTVLPEEIIKDIEVEMTIINGEVVWRSG